MKNRYIQYSIGHFSKVNLLFVHLYHQTTVRIVETALWPIELFWKSAVYMKSTLR